MRECPDLLQKKNILLGMKLNLRCSLLTVTALFSQLLDKTISSEFAGNITLNITDAQ